MARILLIDDDQELLDVLALAFDDAGHSVVTARDGQEGLDAIAKEHPDVVVSDVNMPRIDGFALCRALRDAGDDVPLVMLTSRDSEIDEALGLELGADDYVPKPFSTRVLLARIKSLLRRESARRSSRPSSEIIRAGELILDPDRLEVSFSNQPVVVTVTEFRLLEVLAAKPGKVFSRDRLLDLLRGDDVVVGDRLIDTYVRRLRRKLEAVEPGFDGIETVVGAGYRWRE
jgi:DNA-binding response OmpR family regulator